MKKTYTRRRFAASVAAIGGLIAGFPKEASASCSGTEKHGFFTVIKRQDGAMVRHEHRYDKYALDALLTLTGKARIDIYYYEILEKRSYDAVMYFDDRTEYRLPVEVTHTYPNNDPQFSVFTGWVEVDSALIRLFRAAQYVNITINRRGSRNVAFATSPRIGLTGSSKATIAAGEAVRRCRASQSGGGDLPPGECFLTTACVDMLGLADDCYELRTLRGFRDGTMAGDAEGRAMAQAYRDLAPEILAALPIEHRDRILRALYGRYILPSVLAVRLGMKGLARKIYIKGMVKLMRQYTPDLLDARREDLIGLFGDRARKALE